jgi:hypothetical protein
MRRIALTIAALLLGLASTADAQDRARSRYVQRTDHYAQVLNYWAYQLGPDSGLTPVAVFGGSGIVVGTNLRCNACGAVGHYSCGANVPLYITHYSWELMP